MKLLSLQRPYALHCDFGPGLFSVPLELSGPQESHSRYVNRSYRTKYYQLLRLVLENGLHALHVDLIEDQVEWFASKEQHTMQLYCWRCLNNPYPFYWRSIGLCYANLPFFQLAKVLTKIALERARVVLCTPGRGPIKKHVYERGSLDHKPVGRTQLPNGPIYVPKDSRPTMLAPEWRRFLFIVGPPGTLEPPRITPLSHTVSTLCELKREHHNE